VCDERTHCRTTHSALAEPHTGSSGAFDRIDVIPSEPNGGTDRSRGHVFATADDGALAYAPKQTNRWWKELRHERGKLVQAARTSHKGGSTGRRRSPAQRC
jgi:hypothetical protein